MGMRLFKVLIAVLMAVAVVSPEAFAAGGRSAGGKKLVVVLADSVNFRDWAASSLGYFRELESQGAVGLMVTRTGAPSDSESAPQTTLSAGLPARTHANGRLAFNTVEVYLNSRAGIVYTLRTGLPAPAGGVGNNAWIGNSLSGLLTPKGGVVHLGIGSLAAANETTEWRARPGALGSLLRDNGVCAAAIGNADVIDRPNRSGAIVAMDENGVVPLGDVSVDLLVEAPQSLEGLATNYDLLKSDFLMFYGECDFIVVDFRDTTIADRFGEVATPDMFQAAKLQALDRLGAFLRDILPALDLKKTQLIVVSPSPPSGAISIKETLTPIMALGAGIPRGPSLLTSAATKRPGLVRNTDFAPHVCKFFGIKPAPDFIGSPFEAAPNPAPIPYLMRFFERDAFVESHVDLLKFAIFWHLAILLVCFLTALRIDAAPKWWRRVLTVLIFFTAPMFLSFLVIAGLPQLNFEPAFTLCFLGISAALGLAVGLIPGYQYKLLALSSLYLVALVADQLTGGQLIKNAVLGYYPQNGARFYGLGNEYMGFLIGAPLVAFGVLLDEIKKGRTIVKIAMAVVLAGVMIVVGAPFIGANFGGLISVAFGFVCMLLLAQGRKLNWNTVAISLAAVFAVACVFVWVEMAFLGGESHIGRLYSRIIGGGGAAELFKVVARKFELNVHLLQVSFWSALFVILVAITLSFYYFPIDRARKIFARFNFFRIAYLSALCGSLMAFLVNDSGIVPGATSLILPTAGIFLFLFNYDEKKKASAGKDSRAPGQTPAGMRSEGIQKTAPQGMRPQAGAQIGGGKKAPAAPAQGRPDNRQGRPPYNKDYERRDRKLQQGEDRKPEQSPGRQQQQPGQPKQQQQPAQPQQKQQALQQGRQGQQQQRQDQNKSQPGGAGDQQNKPGGGRRRRRRRGPRPGGPGGPGSPQPPKN